MEQSKQKMVKCNDCSYLFDTKEIRLLNKIVSKKNTTAVKYYFVCPSCGKEYVCYYRDIRVNNFFKQGKQDEARKRMKWLKRYFDDSSL